jgi:hypothetical protein
VKVKYEDIRLSENALKLIAHANIILDEYQNRYQLDLTLRQLYYQFVARGLLPNTVQSYKRLGQAVNDGRLMGLIDWDHIVDRTRTLRGINHYAGPRTFLKSMAYRFHRDKWKNQPTRPEIWIEKDAALGVVETVCARNQVDFFSCRGFTSQSEMRVAALRILDYLKKGQNLIIYHIGDHDPSGIDMSRDIEDRLRRYLKVERAAALAARLRQEADVVSKDYGYPNWAAMRRAVTPELARYVADMCAEKASRGFGAFRFERIALNMDQVRELDPPPNPAKLSDSRAQGYIARFGHQSWELDAMPPEYLRDLIQSQIERIRDEDLWALEVAKESRERNMLIEIGDNWDDVRGFLKSRRPNEPAAPAGHSTRGRASAPKSPPGADPGSQGPRQSPSG